MPDNLRVVPWEQFNTYNREIMEKVESLDTTDANENDVLTYTGNNITWQAPASELPSTGGNIGDVLTGTGDTSEGVKGLPEGADGETNGKVLTYTSGTEKYDGVDPFPPTDSANDGDVLTYDNGQFGGQTHKQLPSTNNASNGDILVINDTGEIEGKMIIPPSDGLEEGSVLTLMLDGSDDSETLAPRGQPKELPTTEEANNGDVLTYNGGSISWTPPLPSTEYVSGGNVLTYNGSNLEGTHPLPSTDYASSGNVLTYNNGDFEGSSPFPSTENASSGDILTISDTGDIEGATPQSGDSSNLLAPGRPGFLASTDDGTFDWFVASGCENDYDAGIPYLDSYGRFSGTKPTGDGTSYVLVARGSGNEIEYSGEPYNN